MAKARLLNISLGDWILPVVYGVITTALFYEGYGVGNHIEQLPIINRFLDSNYLRNDFFTNASTTSIARLGYSQFIAILAGSQRNLPIIFLFTTLVSNISISFITYLLAKSLFLSSRAGVWASALSMSLSTFSLGWFSNVYQTTTIPSTIAVPLIFGSLYFLMHGQIILAVLIGIISSIFHPLFGLEVTALGLIAYLILQLIKNRKINKESIIALFLFVIFSSVILLTQSSRQTLESHKFIYILAKFRHPHHYLPSTFDFRDYVNAGAFLLAVSIIFLKWLTTKRSPLGLLPAVISGGIIILCIGGYLFVEIYPSRIWTTAQTFRLLYVLKWLGIVFIAGGLFQITRNEESSYLVSVITPISLMIYVLLNSIREYLNYPAKKYISTLLSPTLILLSIVFVITVLRPSTLSILSLLLYSFLYYLYETLSNRTRFFVTVGIFSVFALFFFYPGQLPYIEQKFDFISQQRKNFSSNIKPELDPDGVIIAEFVKENTPEESIFLTPPLFGQFRLLANRAIVVDFKAFPFSDPGIEEWYERIINCYGIPSSMGFGMLGELYEHYRAINDAELLTLQSEYGFDYAVLYRDTPTNFEVVFENNTYKLVYVK